MIFQSALRRELLSTAGAVLTTLFTITITVMLIRILGQAAGGRVASEDVVALIGFTALNYLPIILILTSFISVLLVVSRWYQDSEMVVWFAAGQSLTAWVRPVVTFGAPMIAMTALLSLTLTPWANRQSAEYRSRFEQREDVSRVSPGKFQESAASDRVFFVEGLSNDASNVSNVFVNSNVNGRPSIVVANEGTVEIDRNGDKFLVLKNGRRYDGTPATSDFQLMEFVRYGVLISQRTASGAGDLSARALTTTELIANPNSFNRGELLWRIALPFMCLLLMMLAIPLSFVNPRRGRSINLLIALFLFVLYSNTVSVFQAAVVQERMSLLMGWWPVHVLTATLVGALFLWRINVNNRWHPKVMLASMRNARRTPPAARAGA